MGSRSLLSLTILKGDGQGRTVPVDRPLAVGSSRQSDVHIRDASVSWNHARIWPEDGDLFVEDLGSASGTLLNGSAVRKANLGAGDVVAVGSAVLGLHELGSPAPSVDSTAAAPVAASKPAATTSRSGASMLDRLAEAESLLEESERARGKLNKKLEKAAEQLAEVESERDRFKSQAADLKKQGRAATSSKSQLGKELQTLRDENEKSARDIERLRSEAENQSRELGERRAELDRSKEEVEQLRALRIEGERTVAQAVAARETAELRQKSVEGDLARAVEAREEQRAIIAELEREKARFEGAALSVQVELDRGRAEVERWQARARELEIQREGDAKQLRDEIRQAEQSAQSAISKRESEIETLVKAQVDRERRLVERELERAASHAAGLVEQLDKQSSEGQRLAAELSRAAQESGRLEEELRQSDQRAKLADQRVEECEERIAANREEAAALREALAAETKAAAASKSELLDLDETVRRVRLELDESSAQSAKREAEIERLVALCDDLEADQEESRRDAEDRSSEAQREIDELRDQLRSAERVYRELQQRADAAEGDRARLETELGLSKGYTRELKDRLREREREVLSLKAKVRDASLPDDAPSVSVDLVVPDSVAANDEMED